MTTSQSPLRVIKTQADEIARTIKAAERGEQIDVRFAEKITEARGKESITVGVVMDDKIIKLTLPWVVIHASSQVSLSEYIVRLMREERLQ